MMDCNSKNNALFDSQIVVTAAQRQLSGMVSNLNNDASFHTQFAIAVAQPPLSSSVAVLPPRVSLIDNKYAQACSLKRALGSSSLSSHKTPKVRAGNTPGTPVRIVSSDSLQSASLSGKQKPRDDETCIYTYIESVLVGGLQRGNNDKPANKRRTMQPIHASEYLTPTAEQIAAYSHDAIAAVRTNDVVALRHMHREGRILRCCNHFGESLLHTACRRSDAAVVSFLLTEAGVSPRIRDDYGRTPLHDACWRGAPAYDVVEALLHIEPRLAFVPDVRGHKPFQYARKEHRGAWKEFLGRRRDLIL